MKTIKMLSIGILTGFILLLNAETAIAQKTTINSLSSGRSDRDHIKAPTEEKKVIVKRTKPLKEMEMGKSESKSRNRNLKTTGPYIKKAGLYAGLLVEPRNTKTKEVPIARKKARDTKVKGDVTKNKKRPNSTKRCSTQLRTKRVISNEIKEKKVSDPYLIKVDF